MKENAGSKELKSKAVSKDPRIIFIYIESEQHHFIVNQGFNFSSEYRFEFVEEDGLYALKKTKLNCDRAWHGKFYSPVQSVTAVVGENGSGKTTLLKTLCKTMKRSDISYILVMEEYGKLKCYMHFEWYRVVKECPDVEFIYVSDYNYQGLKNTHSGLFGYTIIAFTNSQYGWADIDSPIELQSGLNGDGNVYSELYLNPQTIDDYAHKYYVSKNKPYVKGDGGYESYIEICRNKFKGNRLQQLLDVNLYVETFLDKRISKTEKDNILTWYQPIITMEFGSYTENIRDILKKRNSGEPMNAFEEHIEAVDGYLYTGKYQVINNPFEQLWKNLIFEAVINIRDSNEAKKALFEAAVKRGSLSQIAEEILENEKLKLYSTVVHKNMLNYKEEILELQNKVRESSCLYDRHNMVYRINVREKGNMKLLKYISDIIKKNNNDSFVIRYIKFSGLTFSSGERALLNLYTWTRLGSSPDSFFKNTVNNVPIRMKDNILLLIDEIDLYLHPKWQRRIVDEIIRASEYLFKGKSVSIVFSTHSPIVLSDVLKGDVIYLNLDAAEKRCNVDSNDEHKDTFGAQIYNLYNDAFFLENKSQIGAFSLKRLKSMISDFVKQDETIRNNTEDEMKLTAEERKLMHEELIPMIGDALIKSQMKNLRDTFEI